MTTINQMATFDDLASMIAYIEGNCAKITDLVREIEEIQREFETRFVLTQQKFENAKAAALVWIEEHGWKEPQWLMQEVEERLPEMRKTKQAHQQDLQDMLVLLEEQREQIEAQNTASVEALKQSNPRLNAREEELKATVDETRAAVEEKTRQWRAAGSGLGWLVQPGKVRKLRHELEALTAKLSNMSARLTEVRNSWVALEQKADEGEQRLQEAWRLRTAEIARLNRELGRLQKEFETVCREAALDELLNAIAAPKDGGQPDFDAKLAEIVRLHDETNSYEAGIAQVAELMGMMKGLCEGLTRMKESVASVKAEQDMHSELANLKFEAPEPVLSFHQIWDRLRPVVLDEKQAAEHPREFAANVKQAIGDWLSNDRIDLMFNALGAELKRATDEQW